MDTTKQPTFVNLESKYKTSSKKKLPVSTKVYWKERHTGDLLEGIIIKQYDNSAIVELQGEALNQLDKYKLESEKTVVAYKRLLVAN